MTLYRGEYKQRDNEYDLYPTDSMLPDKIVFRAVSSEELVLDTDIGRSAFGDSYTLNKPEIKTEYSKDIFPAVYYYVVEPATSLGQSTLELLEDGTFILTEVQGMGATQIVGKYGYEGGVIMCSNFDSFRDFNGNDVYNFELTVESEYTVALNEDLSVLAAGSVFSTQGKKPVNTNQVSAEVILKFVHAPIEGVNEEYLPSITLYSDGGFTYVENCYAGMVEFYGSYSQIPMGYNFMCTDMSNMMGFAGEDVSGFSIYYDKAVGDYKIDNSICMTMADDVFYAYYYGE